MALPRYRYHKKKKRTGSRFKQGVYIPVNEDKYRAPQDNKMNSSGIGMTYRSSWELEFAKYLDHSENILYWGSEPFAIPYISPKDNQPHRYYIDFVFMTTTKEKFLIEIKPKGQTKDPVNLAKWEAAER